MRRIQNPDCRGGATTEVKLPVRAARGSMGAMLDQLRGDANLLYLTERVQNYSELAEARLHSLRLAIDAQNGSSVVDVAHALTDATAKLGSVRMMRLAIALQMLGRRQLFAQAKTLADELQQEFESFKETLIPFAG